MIIPTHNRSDLLGRAISSVLAQKYRPMEVLVIDDGSTEDIVSSVQAVAGKCARVIRRDTRGGAAAARNTGCQAAKNDYLAFLDSDDEWLPEKLETQISYLEANPGIELCCSAYEIIHPDGGLETRGFRNPTATRDELAFGCGLSPGSSLVVRRDFLNRIGPFDENLERFEDWDWLMRATDHSAIGLVNTPLCRIYTGARPPQAQVDRSIRRLRTKHGGIYKRIGATAYLKFRAGLRNEQAVAAHSAGRFILAAMMLSLSFLLYPIRPRELYPRIWRKGFRHRLMRKQNGE